MVQRRPRGVDAAGTQVGVLQVVGAVEHDDRCLREASGVARSGNQRSVRARVATGR